MYHEINVGHGRVKAQRNNRSIYFYKKIISCNCSLQLQINLVAHQGSILVDRLSSQQTPPNSTHRFSSTLDAHPFSSVAFRVLHRARDHPRRRTFQTARPRPPFPASPCHSDAQLWRPEAPRFTSLLSSSSLTYFSRNGAQWHVTERTMRPCLRSYSAFNILTI